MNANCMEKKSQNSKARPLITMVVLGYNQDRFIRAAINGAFSQTYTPLEIVLSDDCSTDQTFSIMTEMANSYNGPHTIVLNQNERNVGLGEHINRAFALSSGEWFVAAAGDDISEPNRIEKIHKAFQSCTEVVSSVFSAVRVIDDNGNERGFFAGCDEAVVNDLYGFLCNPYVGVSGCAAAYHRDVFYRFGPMLEGTVAEDRVLTFRAALLGRIVRINEPLVQYRRHDAAITGGVVWSNVEQWKNRGLRRCASRIMTLKNYCRDVQLAHLDRVTEDYRRKSLVFFSRQIMLLDTERRLLAESTTKNVLLFPRMVFSGFNLKTIMSFFLIAFMPRIWMRRIAASNRDPFLDQQI